MLDIKFIKDNPEIVKEAAKKKHVEVDIDKLLKLEGERVALLQVIEEMRERQNKVSKEIGSNKGSSGERETLIAEMGELKEKLGAEEDKLKPVMDEWRQIMIDIPNIPSPDTPVGEDESGNVVVKQVGEKPEFNFEPKAHWDLGPELDLIDNERAARVSGARFTYIKGDLVKLQFALINFVLDIVTNEDKIAEIAKEAGIDISNKAFVPVLTPDMVKPEIMMAMGRLDPPEDKYYLEKDNLYLAGSAEHALGPMHMGEILEAKDLPLRYIGYSTAFRREAGSYGKDTKGILRVHQFDKLEMETFCLPEESISEQNLLIAIQEHIVATLGLPYQVVSVCTGDMGFPDQRQMDIETWMPGQDTYRETHTSDLVGAFQPRRLNIRTKRDGGNPEYVHMNDATALALGRIMIAILENFQQEDGSVTIPEVLRPYMGGQEKISPKS